MLICSLLLAENRLKYLATYLIYCCVNCEYVRVKDDQTLHSSGTLPVACVPNAKCSDMCSEEVKRPRSG